MDLRWSGDTPLPGPMVVQFTAYMRHKGEMSLISMGLNSIHVPLAKKAPDINSADCFV